MDTVVEFLKPHLLPLLWAVVIVAVLPLVAGYIVLLERKVMADIQARLGPMRVGPHGLLQPIADALKLLLKEDIIPANADKWIFWIAPLISVTAAMLALSAMPFGPVFQIADLNVGLLFIVAVSSLGIFGIVLGGWSSNSHYALLGALRSAAQVVSYEVAVGLALVSGLLLAGTLSMRKIVEAQAEQGIWFVFLVPIGFFIYLVAGIAELNRAPFDLPEAESELVAGYMTEYSGFRWALYFLGEYTAMLVVGGIGTTLFLGGWLRPFPNVAAFDFLDYLPAVFFLALTGYCFYRAPKQPVPIQKAVLGLFGLLCFGITAALGWAVTLPAEAAARAGILGAFWFLAKVFLFLYSFMWFRFTFPRYRFDQLMRLGWHFLIPVSLVNVMGVGAALVLHRQAGWPLWQGLGLGTVATLAVAAWLVLVRQRRPVAAPTAGGEV
jgi:NADH-quinone oxidoreductase subunit H